MSKPEPSSEPHPDSEPEKSIPFPNAEPRVNLNAVHDSWRFVFKCHWVSFAGCFALLALHTIYQFYKTYRRKKLRNRTYVSLVQILVIMLGTTRALALCLSPYELTKNVSSNLPDVVPRLLLAWGFPCLFSGFTFVHKIFLNVSKVQVLSSKNALGNKLITVVLFLHFLVVLSTEVITTFVRKAKFLLVVCALYYVMGCLGISISLLFSGRRVVTRTRKIQANLCAFKKSSEITSKTIFPGKTVEKFADATWKVLRITAMAVVCGFSCSLLYIYTLVWMIRAALGDNSTPSPWIWLTVNSFIRLFELILAITMSYAVGCSYQRGTLNHSL